MRRALMMCGLLAALSLATKSVDAQTGACCVLGSPLCDQMTQLQCMFLMGSTYKGDGIPCTPNPCDCCGTDGTEMRGNANMQGGINITDLTFMVGCAFFIDCFSVCFAERDVDGNGTFNIVDVSRLVQYLFMGGPPPAMCP